MKRFAYFMLCVWTFVMVGRPQDILEPLKALHPGDVGAALTILGFLFSGQARKAVFSYQEMRLFLLFAILAAVSTPFGYYPSESLSFVIAFCVKFGIYLYLLVRLVNTEEEIEGLVKTMALCGLTLAALAVLKRGTADRIGGGSTYDPNDLAMIIVSTMPIMVLYGFTVRRFLLKAVYFGGAACAMVGIIATMSRGGFLGLMGVFLATLTVRIPGFPKTKLLATMAVLGAIFVGSMGAEYKERLATINEDASSLTAGSGRILVWKRAIQIAKEHPIFGTGPDTFDAAYGDYLEHDRFKGELSVEESGGYWKTAHNSYLLVLVEMGVPGFIIFMAFIIRSFRNVKAVKALYPPQGEPARMVLLASALQLGLVGYMITAFFLSQSYGPTLYFTCVLSGVMLRMASVATTREQEEGPHALGAIPPSGVEQRVPALPVRPVSAMGEGQRGVLNPEPMGTGLRRPWISEG